MTSTSHAGERDLETGQRRPRSLSSESEIGHSGHQTDADSTLTSVKTKAARLLGFTTDPNSPAAAKDDPVPQKLASLVLANRATDDSKILEAEIGRIQRGTTPDGIDPIRSDGMGRDIMGGDDIRGAKKAHWGSQFVLLSGRAFKNLYR
jgi:hypothetical protein